MRARVLLHIGFWFGYLCLRAYVTADLGNASFRDFGWAYRIGMALLQELVVFPAYLSLFYGLFYWLLPAYQRQPNWRRAVPIGLIIILALLIYRLGIKEIVYPMIYGELYPGNAFAPSLLINTAIDLYTLVGIAGMLHLYRHRLRQQERERQLEREKLQSELHFLRAQINPHFFFNTLNNIYALARKNSTHTAEVVMRLSKMMRFILYECSGDRIRVTDEVKLIEDYIALEQLRYNERLQLTFERQIDDEHQQIGPLLLLPFVENSFKHGASESRFDIFIKINLRVEKQMLYFTVSNNLEMPPENTEGTGLGLQNVRRQLELIYPDRYQLEIEPQANQFSIRLQIQLAP